MASPTRAPRNEPSFETTLRGAVLPWLILLPAILLALPGPLAPLADDLYPHLAGAGWILFASIPAVAALVVLRVSWRIRGWLAFLVPLTLALLSALLRDADDPFEARRALCHLTAMGAAFLGGAALARRGRNQLEWGLLVLSIVWTLYALGLDLLGSNGHLAGVLGDTGSLSQAALPGAVLGAWYAASRTGKPFVAGCVAAGLFVAHAAVTPVLAGALSFSAVLLLCLLATPFVKSHGPARRILGFFSAAGLLAVVLFQGVGSLTAPPADPQAVVAPVTPDDANLGGVEVRARVWTATLSLIGHHPLGVGPGQFQSAFPPYRDPREIEVSRHGVCKTETTEVEHAHNDLLQVFAELGFLGGGSFLVFLALVLFSCTNAVRSDYPDRNPLGAAGYAVAINSLFHAPLTLNPAAAVIAMACFGAVLATDVPPPPQRPKRWVALSFSVLVLAMTPFALDLVRHGAALSTYAERAAAIDRLKSAAPDAETVERMNADLRAAKEAVDTALERAPSSAPARMLAAQLAGTEEEQLAAWEAVLEVRPHSVEAIESLGVAAARGGRVPEARVLLSQALELAPDHPRLLKNLARLELTSGRPLEGLSHLAVLGERGCRDEDWVRSLGTELILVHGRTGAGAELLFEKPLSNLVAGELHGLSLAPEPERSATERSALECLAQLSFGREHMEADNPRQALISLRLALNQSRPFVEGGAPALRVETAAAALLADRDEEAERLLGDLPFDLRTWEELPSWARAALQRAERYR